MNPQPRITRRALLGTSLLASTILWLPQGVQAGIRSRRSRPIQFFSGRSELAGSTHQVIVATDGRTTYISVANFSSGSASPQSIFMGKATARRNRFMVPLQRIQRTPSETGGTGAITLHRALVRTGRQVSTEYRAIVEVAGLGVFSVTARPYTTDLSVYRQLNGTWTGAFPPAPDGQIRVEFDGRSQGLRAFIAAGPIPLVEITAKFRPLRRPDSDPEEETSLGVLPTAVRAHAPTYLGFYLVDEPRILSYRLENGTLFLDLGFFNETRVEVALTKQGSQPG